MSHENRQIGERARLSHIFDYDVLMVASVVYFKEVKARSDHATRFCELVGKKIHSRKRSERAAKE